MKPSLSGSKHKFSIDVEAVADLIKKTQKHNGEIPWCRGAKTDPWDHVEAAMGLSIGGYYQEAQQAFNWMARMQGMDGSWYSSYRDGVAEDTTRDTNMSSYVAVGVLHHYLITRDLRFLHHIWPTVRSAIEFALSLQTPEGEIFWAISPGGEVDQMALLTGSSSIYMSIKCALAIASILGHAMPHWEQGLKNLGDAIRYKPHRFNMTKSRYSMDWFYPVLSGALNGEAARQRIKKFWKKFVIEGQGVRCVSDRPWVTVAETCELSLALSAMGDLDLAETLFSWIQDKTNKDGSYWCGFTCPDMTIWPEDKTTWTNAVVLIAADAIYDLTPGGQLFSHKLWSEPTRFSSSYALDIYKKGSTR